jgi:hypothetical protein
MRAIIFAFAASVLAFAASAPAGADPWADAYNSCLRDTCAISGGIAGGGNGAGLPCCREHCAYDACIQAHGPSVSHNGGSYSVPDSRATQEAIPACVPYLDAIDRCVRSRPHPSCNLSRWHASPFQGNPVSATMESNGGATCSLRVVTPEPNRQLQIASPPGNGVLTPTGALSMTYQPSPGFHGQDQFTINYCGADNQGRSGCVAINYQVTVQ